MIKIGDLAKLSGVTVKAIRFYEKKKLLTPAEVNFYTGYRYYDENSIKRLAEIVYLKKLGFSLKEIASFDENTIQQKTKQLEMDIAKLRQNIAALNLIHKNKKGEFVMNSFVNDAQTIGKWQRVCAVKNKQEFLSGKYTDNKEIFGHFKEIVFLPEGKGYWCFKSWSKGQINVSWTSTLLNYEIDGEYMFITVTDTYDDSENDVVVYRKIDSKEYTIKDLMHGDNIDIPFENDQQALGLWESVDFIKSDTQFDPNKKQYTGTPWLTSLSIMPNGEVLVANAKEELFKAKWSKGMIGFTFEVPVAMHYEIKNINGKDYLIMEWKSGDYIFGGYIQGCCVFEKVA